MMPKLTLGPAIIALAVSIACAEEAEELERIVVTPSRMVTELGSSSRSIRYLDGKDIEYSVYRDVPDTLAEIGGIDVRRRGPEGVQSDISIRGTTFEQNASLLDGVRSSDPQTGHFNTDWPVTMMDVERVEIVKGPSSSVYGPNAFGGVVNVVTKRPEGEGLLVYGEGGSFDYAAFGCSNTVSVGPFSNRFSIEERRATGYMPESQFDIFTLTDTALFRMPSGDLGFLFGYMYKDFGAADFYSNLYPNEDERTDTRFFRLNGDFDFGAIAFNPDLYLRRHRDKFSLDANRPGWQTNYHTTYNYGGDLDFALENTIIDAAFGYELYRDTVDSTNLQTHSRTVDGLYLEVAPHLAKGLQFNAAVRWDYYGDFGWECSPTVSAGWKALEWLTARGVVGRAYRIPTFTDLYYNDAANRGNSSLRPEYCWSYEAGLDADLGPVRSSVTYFHRDTSDAIDWIRYSSRGRWQASNIGTAVTNGVEASLKVPVARLTGSPLVREAFVEYTGIDTVAKHDYLSKYVSDYLKQHICAGAEFDVFGFRNFWVLNYRKRVGSGQSVVVDMKISKELVRKGRVSFEAYLEISNLFDEQYCEQSGVEMPGRWIKSGGRIAF